MPTSAGPGPDARNALLAADLEQRLREAGDPERAAAERAYLKSSMEFAGVRLPSLREMVRAQLPRRPTMPRDDLLAVVTELWARPLFFIRKAIGWVLRDTGRRRPDLLAAWVEPRIGQIFGVTLREAVKPLPPETAARLLAAYRARPRVSRRPAPGGHSRQAR